VKVAAVPGVRPVSIQSIEQTERELTKLIIEARGGEAAHDPGIALAARDAAELAHGNGADLVAVVEHPAADPAVLIGMMLDAPASPEEIRDHLRGGPDLREVTEARTDRGYPVIIAEHLLVDGCQLQAIVIDPSGRRLAVFTLHSVTGRGWLELATLLGRLVSTVAFAGAG
jgi:hypothetical protein